MIILLRPCRYNMRNNKQKLASGCSKMDDEKQNKKRKEARRRRELSCRLLDWYSKKSYNISCMAGLLSQYAYEVSCRIRTRESPYLGSRIHPMRQAKRKLALDCFPRFPRWNSANETHYIVVDGNNTSFLLQSKSSKQTGFESNSA